MISAEPPLSATFPASVVASDGLNYEPKLAINSVSLDDIDFPRERAGFLYRNANAISLRIGGREHDDGNRCVTQRGTHREMMPQSISVAKGLGARVPAVLVQHRVGLDRHTAWSEAPSGA
jgi:hypothetical protein